ncbi:ferredoxin--NADP reductase [Roseomonas sp. NAR14]|uniref:ferredoxin--NADP(+) reductase n=1 Tax=Roseomonas acroporae TaxID=2937791 RepID=A0A9X2BTG2_9PROT|nr:ferredoxin--NADP reductase [Roseomonas acroporae]MCK8784573.1 ferredoxin--NADP reductase [Roseomonas acroporae]
MSSALSSRPAPAKTAPFFQERVLTVHHWTDKLFSFTATRDPALRFQAGQFVMIGLEVEGKPLLRAYSIASAPWEETLEFLSIKVPNGPLTSRLKLIQPGDTLLVGRKPVGTLVTDSLLPGRTLWLIGTGTGLAPWMSLIREPDVYDRFERVVVVHGVREVAELAYQDYITRELPAHELLGELVADKLLYYPTVTREAFRNQGRVTDLIENGRLFADLGLPPISPEADRVMLCGSPAMLTDVTRLLEARGFAEGSHAEPGHYVIEKAFVEK